MTNIPMSRAVHFDDFIIVSDVDMATLLTNHIHYNLTKKKLITSLSWELVVAYQASLTDDQLYAIITKIKLELDSYEDALETAAAALALFVECRKVAGSPKDWAGPLQTVVKECLMAGPPHDQAARALAGRAVAGFFPPEALATMNQEERNLAQSLRALAETPSPTSPALPP